MALKNFLPVLQALVFGILVFALHQLVFYVFGFGQLPFYYPLWKIYGLFTICAMLITAVSVIIKRKSIDNTGQVFLLLTCGKIGIAFAVLHPILESASPILGLEKFNFFLIFALFLTLETILTIRILNKK